MTREEAKELLPIIQAWADGKSIQYQTDSGSWSDITKDLYPCNHPSLYRVKPEPKYRPFNTQEECWEEMLKHQPFGWLKSKKDGRFRCIGEVSGSEEFEIVYIALSTSGLLSRKPVSLFNEYTFADGAPFGINEE